MLDSLNLASLDARVVSTVIVVLTGLAALYRHYSRTGSIPLSKIPLRAIRKVVYEFRVIGFTTSPTIEKEPLHTNIETVTANFATNGYELEWPFSYHYRGSDENLRRYFYDPKCKYPHRQMHVRLFEQPDGDTVIHAHEEPSALHHPHVHVSEEHVTGATEWAVHAYEAFGTTDDPLDPTKFDRAGDYS